LRRTAILVLAALLALPLAAAAAKPAATSTPETTDVMSADTFKGLELRGLGPAFNSGRITDLAIDPTDHSRWFVASASGGVWRTDNAGTTWTPVFDEEGSYSIGCITLDPANPHVVWVGSGENNSQRSVSWGDGVYRSRDGGVTWENLGLKHSEHIGKILVDPRDSKVVYVAAQGPLWNSGGDRGLYKTTDGGATWTKVLDISPDTGVNDVVMDPRDPDVLIASSYQRRRHVWTLIDGGPESTIYKSTDAGATWRKVEKGLPKVDKGRIGLAISPADPDIVYAIVEAAQDEGGFFRSSDRGETWDKRSKAVTTSPQYYNEIFADPKDVDRVYSMDTWMQVTEDGGTTFKKVGETFKHVDNHVIWIDPTATEHLIAGCDGGLYESFDRGATWNFFGNLPVTQFYRVTADNSKPFWFIYGGTQDNNSLGGPSRTMYQSGISNEDWFVTVGGDGYQTRVDPEDPNIVYAEWQYGGLVRHDRRSGEITDIQPQEPPGQPADRWNWDSPVIISPFSHTRLYFASQRVYRSDDRGDSWTAVSPDLTRQLNRDELPIMGKIWSVDAVAKSASTSQYGNIVSLDESPLVEGLLYVGTDDGLVQVSEDGGTTWRKIERFPGVPDRAYVSRLTASATDPDTVFAAFDNHKMGDFAPYLLKSTDRGRTWSSLRGDLPDGHVVWALEQDGTNSQLLFAGTEFGLFFTVDGGAHWVQLKGGMPTIAVRDLEIQRRENDLAIATFGRGFYVLDDYTPLRSVSREQLGKDAVLFPIKDALLYIERPSRKDSRGDSFFTTPNPPFGAVLTYYLKDGVKTRTEIRHEAEKADEKAGKTPPYPSYDALRAEDEEIEPEIVLTVTDEDGQVVRRVTGPRTKGFHRVAWDLRWPAATPVDLTPKTDLAPWETPDRGPLATPGTYTVTLAKVVDGVLSPLGDPQKVRVMPLELATLAAPDKEAAFAFQAKVARLQRAVHGAIDAAKEADTRLKYLRQAILDTPQADPTLLATNVELQKRLDQIMVELKGDPTRTKRDIETPPSISDRVDRIVGDQWVSTGMPTGTQTDGYRWAAEAFADTLARLRTLVDDDLASLESKVESAGGPWTPGQGVPHWSPN